jgi:hypothetical protein
MTCRNKGASWILSISDVKVRICGDVTAAHIVQVLINLFSGFAFPDDPGSDSPPTLSCHYLSGPYDAFSPEPIDLTKTDHPIKARLYQIANRLQGPCTDEDPGMFVVGFLNGCLFYRQGSGRALCLLFCGKDGGDFLVGSLHKLLFVFLCLAMAEESRFLIHGAAVKNGPDGYIFWGASGAGKTTVASFSARQHVLSDDAPLLMKIRDHYFCCATPFCQLNRAGQDFESLHHLVAIRRQFFLHKAEALNMMDRAKSEALMEILSRHLHGFRFMNRLLKGKAFHFFYEFCLHTPAQDLYFTKDNRFWELIFPKG